MHHPVRIGFKVVCGWFILVYYLTFYHAVAWPSLQNALQILCVAWSTFTNETNRFISLKKGLYAGCLFMREVVSV